MAEWLGNASEADRLAGESAFFRPSNSRLGLRIPLRRPEERVKKKHPPHGYFRVLLRCGCLLKWPYIGQECRPWRNEGGDALVRGGTILLKAATVDGVGRTATDSLLRLIRG